MIRDLDSTVEQLLGQKAEPGSELAQAAVSFDLPDSEWRSGLETLTVNGYLYDVRQNLGMRTGEAILERAGDGLRAARRKPPVRLDCAYCITAWSPAISEAVLDEHRLLSQVVKVLLKYPTIPEEVLQGQLKDQIPPYPTVIASQDGVKNQPEFWGALDQQLKPSLNYVVTLAMMLDEEPAQMTRVVEEVRVEPGELPAIVGIEPDRGEAGQALEVVITGKGTHFGSSSLVRFDPGEGLQVNGMEAAKAEKVTVQLTIAPNAPAGRHDLRVVTGSEVACREQSFEVET